MLIDPTHVDAVDGASGGRVVPDERPFGPYRVVGELGEGGMGKVFRAVRADDFRTEVAIKVLRQELGGTESLARFRDERQILASLQHPGIVRLLDGGSTPEGLPYLVMEHVSGVTLSDYVAAKRPSVRARVELMRQICDAVQHAHTHLVIHRDIKPTNILVDALGQPKLLDFGIAKLLADSTLREARTVTGAQVLTPAYATPEQVRAEPVSTATDVYQLGLVLYQMLAGRGAQGNDGDIATLVKEILERDPPPPSSVAPAAERRLIQGDLDVITLKALRKEPDLRYASVALMSEDLRRWLDGLPIEARATSMAYRAGKFLRRNRLLMAVAVAAVVALVSGTVVSLVQAQRADAEAAKARHHFATVRRFANTLIFDVDDKIRDLEGSAATREQIVASALAYLNELAPDAGDDPALAVELGNAYIKIGEIQGSEFAPSFGRIQDAVASYERARALVSAVPSDTPGAEWTLGLATNSLGSARYSLGQREQGLKDLAESLRILEAVPRGPDFNYFRFLLAYGNSSYGEQNSGATDAVVRAGERATAIAGEWYAATGLPDARFWMGVGHDLKSSGYFLLGDPTQVIAESSQAVGIFAELVAAHPTNAMYTRELGMARILLAEAHSGTTSGELWYARTSDYAAAERELRASLVLWKKLADMDHKDVRATRSYRDYTVDLALVLAAGDAAGAVALAEGIEVELAPRLAGADDVSTSPRWYRDCSLALPYARLGRREEALARIARGLEDAAREQGDLLEVRLHLPQCRYLAALARHALGDDGEAKALLVAARAAVAPLVAERPLNIKPYIGSALIAEALAESVPSERCVHMHEARAALAAWPGPVSEVLARERARLDAAVTTCSPAP